MKYKPDEDDVEYLLEKAENSYHIAGFSFWNKIQASYYCLKRVWFNR